MAQRSIREQRYHFVSTWDEVTPGFAYAHIDLESAPDEIWTYLHHIGEPDKPPQGWEQVCPSCSAVFGPEARFCPQCGVACVRRGIPGAPFMFNRTWGYWLDQGHDWSWRRSDTRSFARINNAGSSTPGFWIVMTYYD